MKVVLTDQDVKSVVIRALTDKGVLSKNLEFEGQFDTYSKDFLTISLKEPEVKKEESDE